MLAKQINEIDSFQLAIGRRKTAQPYMTEDRGEARENLSTEELSKRSLRQ